MTAQSIAAGGMQLAGVALAPLVVGCVQWLKARAQGRRGASALQPYREIRRLWSRSGVRPESATAVYEVAVPLAVASTILALLLLPIGSVAPDWGLGNDALVLFGLLAVGRFALAAAAWDTGSGFELMGVARDLTFAVFVDALFLVVLALLAYPAHSTDLVAMSGAAASGEAWREPAQWAAAIGLVLVILAETGRRPIDNPDTHLELTMVHEGPTLEYAGRDLALLHWTAAARTWAVLVLAAEVLVPHPGSFAAQLLWLTGWLTLFIVLLAAAETTQPKMRLLRVPALLYGGAVIVMIGLAGRLLGASA
ncbi:MAG: NADH-quinone oxidoreductase subunit H [Thermoleophilia bacterium]|nr:NADH-quinone oxidoreductase subunit H [Thermoleophilia bacterium]